MESFYVTTHSRIHSATPVSQFYEFLIMINTSIQKGRIFSYSFMLFQKTLLNKFRTYLSVVYWFVNLSACEEDRYGPTCSETCSENCRPQTLPGARNCSELDGSCLLGCIAGWRGNRCDESISSHNVLH